MRRYIALAAAVTALAVAAPPALADSIVYEKDGNVWLANPDGSGQRQVTTSGGYSKPTQANDGTIVAVKDKLLQRLDRQGNLLNLAGESGGSGPLTPALAPDGSLVAYNYIASPGPSNPVFSTALSQATRQTSHEEVFYISAWSNPSWVGNDKVLMFDGSPTFTGDTLIKTLAGAGTQTWFEDPDLNLTGGEVDASQTRLAATDGTVIRIYRLNQPPPAIDVQAQFCFITGPDGSFFRPTWSPDGTRLAWQEDNGIWVGNYDPSTCQPNASLAIPGGRAPDWGPADVGSGGGAALTAKVPKRIGLKALLKKGLKVRANCRCRVTATLSLKNKRLGQAKKTITHPTTLKVKPTRKGKARLRKGGKSVRVVVAGGGKFVTRKVKVVR